MRTMFGTDGIRGRADAFPLDDATMTALGTALARRLRTTRDPEPAIVLGMDTRQSGPRIALALRAGIEAGGGRAVIAGVIPTPGVAYLCRMNEFVAGISISASHNPFEDNGVKVFGHDGMKIADDLEAKIEQELMEIRDESHGGYGGTIEESKPLIDQYERFLLDGIGEGTLAGRKIVIDAGHGAAWRIGPETFRRAGADVVVMNASPDGRNINLDSGALHPEAMGRRVVEEGADFGVAFDGDADRAIFADDRGRVRDGDEILMLWGLNLDRTGALRNRTIVATVMSNFGFEKKLGELGIRLVRAQVGDKYVLEEMMKHGAVLGGEQSGHLIDLRTHTTGDGIHTALEMARLLASSPRFSERETFPRMPQILLNERVASKPPLASLPRYQAAAADAESRLGGRGRILVRYSGTENLVRVMVEGEDEAQIREIAAGLAAVLRDEIRGM